MILLILDPIKFCLAYPNKFLTSLLQVNTIPKFELDVSIVMTPKFSDYLNLINSS